jgi:hypothetical protein
MKKELKQLLLLIYEKGVRQEQVDLDQFLEKIIKLKE